MNNILQTHRAEFARAMRNHQYEISVAGILFPKQKTLAMGAFAHQVNGKDYRVEANTVVNQGLNDILNIYFGNVAKNTAYYLAPFSGNVAIDPALTAATFPDNQTEFINYDEAARVVWTHPTTTTDQTMHNTASPSRFTIATGGGTVWGCGMTTVQAQSSTSGKLVAAALFDASRVLLAGDKLDVEYIITASDAG